LKLQWSKMMYATKSKISTLAGKAPLYALAGDPVTGHSSSSPVNNLLLGNFENEEEFLIPGATWRGFSDRVMGGVSNAEFNQDEIEGRRCVRMTGNVTRDSGGGFIQMALELENLSDASPYRGIELLVYGNDEDYNAHVRTADCGWYEESYRATFHAEKRWQTIRLPWRDFKPNGVSTPLDTSSINRLGLLGWMRDFEADLALGAVALYA
jgi:hypothetical protein